MSEQVASDLLSTLETVQEADQEALQEEIHVPEINEALLHENADSNITDTLTKNLSESTDTENTNDQSDLDKTIEDDSSELTNSRKSRELKSILALSKEANLNTNLSRKRKTLEGPKCKESIKNSQPDSDVKKLIKPDPEVKKPIKVTHSSTFKFPVTAEAELEQDSKESTEKVSPDNTINSSKLKRKRDSVVEAIVGGATDDGHRKNRKKAASELKMFKLNKDIFCWRCHREGVNVVCETCPRSYHQRCLKQTISDIDHWPCPECVAILKAESTHTRSEAMKGMSLEHLCSLLKFALNRMMVCQGSEPFLHPVNDAEFPEYQRYIIQPMDLTKLQNNIKSNYYGSTQAFEADAKWILHNSIIFNSYQSKLTSSAKNIIKICKQEMAEIENCPSCYLNANTKKATWFVEVCPRPHLLVWAKLKGFPYWPAKAMSCMSSGMVDVRFFGAHDRAWVNYRDCFLYSEKDPNTFKQKRYDIEKCVEELNIYINNLKKVYGEFRHAPYRTPLDPHNMGKQMLISIPKCKSLSKRRKSQKSSETSLVDEIKSEPKQEDDLCEVKTLQPSSSNEPKDDAEPKETSGEPEKGADEKDYPISEPCSDRTTPAQELDNTMEGYGTDDDSMAEIDLERRRAFADRSDSKVDDEEDDDTDTQVPSNVSLDGSGPKGGFKARSGSGCTSGKTKVIHRRKSEVDNIQKRVSEELYPSNRKTARRNSDLSIKSDSSLLSNISEKINRVDISENMEITLGNDDIIISDNVTSPNGENSKSSSECSFEHKRKPVQVDINNAEFTISPSNKLKISDQLMKRLSDANEGVEEVKKSVFEDKLATDEVTEKVELQQAKIDVHQPSTSESTDHVEHPPSTLQEVDKTVVDMNLNEKNSPAKEITQSERGIVSTMGALDIENDIVEESEEDDISQKKIMESKEEIIAENQTMEYEDEIVAEKESMKDKEGMVTGKEAMEDKEEIIAEKEVIVREENIVSEKETTKNEDILEETGDIEKEDGAEIEEEEIQEVANLVKMDDDSEEFNDMKLTRELTVDSSAKKVIEPAETEVRSILEPVQEKLVESNSVVCNVESPKGDDKAEKKKLIKPKVDKKSIFNIIHSSLNRSKTKNRTYSDPTHKRKHEKLRTKIIETPPKRQMAPKTYSKVEMTKEGAEKSAIGIRSQVLQKFEIKIPKTAAIKNEISIKSTKSDTEDSEPTNKPIPVEKEISTNLINTPKTHSKSLDTDNKPIPSENSMNSKDPSKSDYKSSKTNDKLAADKRECATTSKDSSKSDPQSLATNDKSVENLTIKASQVPPNQTGRKRPSSEESIVPPHKVIKLVSVDSIIHQKVAEAPLLKKPTPNTTPKEIVAEPVKSEPDSDDDFSENENLEAKRQYLSALNISEKTGGSGANKTSEIRTRARAEERRERFRKVDNLTKVIDDVALNYTPEDMNPKVPVKKIERRKSLGGLIPPEGEIYVKSFAKLQTASGGKQRARKTFPTPSYVKAPVRIVLAPKKDVVSAATAKKDNITPVVVTKKDTPTFAIVKKPLTAVTTTSLTSVSKSYITSVSTNSTPVASTASSSKNVQPSVSDTSKAVANVVASMSEGGAAQPMVNLVQAQKPPESAVSNMTHVILMPTPTINYCTPLGNPFMNTQVAMALPAVSNNVPVQPLHHPMLQPAPPNIRTSQNYVPQGDAHGSDSSPDQQSSPAGVSLLNDLLSQTVPAPPTDQPERPENAVISESRGENSGTDCGTAVEPLPDDEFAVLNSIVPDSVSRAVSDLLLRPPPRLRPRPPGILSNTFDEGIPSTAGDVTTRINSVAHRMTDYFRGMLIETLADLGRAANPEAKIINLQVEIETLKHKHNLELSEMRQNVCTILRDVQRSIVEDRERVKDESRARCEAETIKRIELAKSKQWCANCSKEAQFYCCWNTSYCDYPCQQKHWALHMGKCTQNIEKSNNAAPSMSRPAGQPIILRPTAPPKPGVGQRIMAKPTKVYLNRASSPQKVFKTVASSGNHITVIETTPGNYELVGNGPMGVPGGAKFYSVGSNVFTKLKTATSSSTPQTSPSTAAEASRSQAPSAASRGPYALPVAAVMEED